MGSFNDPPFFFALKAAEFDFPGDPHARLKPGGEGRRRDFCLRLDLQIFRLPQNILVLSAGLLVKTSISSSQPIYLLRPGPFYHG
ncbi:hypothetical protein H9X91_12210 [Oscillibacter valericigenes]|uniref:Uncharacterized protein n=1 Tax=Oscillibacter valericigenes TaxID=351091 RepID=A0ABS2FX63_9FIRM|nr:hypothetical protein [Oscillibacter valericigenes]MBM6852204.1 hypothetical protein [Oscillibacter valericigenes]